MIVEGDGHVDPANRQSAIPNHQRFNNHRSVNQRLRSLMKTPIVLAALVLAGTAGTATAQNLVISNARILDGTGRVIERGAVVVRDGKIASVAAGNPAAVPGARVIDARGRTVMPGFIDAHRHPIPNNTSEWLQKGAAAEMRGFLEAGFTTVLSAITSVEGLELRRRTESGAIVGPRIFAAAMIPLAGAAGGGRGNAGGRGGAPAGGGGQAPAGRGDPARFDNSRPPLRPTEPAAAIPAEVTIKAVEAAAKAGFDYIKTIITTTPGGPETETLRLIVNEGKKRNLPTITHAVSVTDTLAAVDAGPAVLVHTPHIGRLEEDPAAVQKVAKAGIPMTSTLAVFIPHFGPDNTPLFRDGQPFPWNTISSAGQGPVNARLLWEAGISYGYGTDTSWPPKESLKDELRALSVVFSPRDIVTILTRNAARSVLKPDQLGTLEPGKLADIVIIDGDPLADIYEVLKVVTTVKGGVVVFEAAASGARAGR
jgi:imidazolonepropionase-like amidohydrolase